MAEFPVFVREVRDAFFKAKDADKAWSLIQPQIARPDKAWPMPVLRAVFELAALILRARKDYPKAASLYVTIEDWYQAGYCDLLCGNLAGVQNHWMTVLKQRQSHWCLALYGLISQQLSSWPSLLQIRNHLESDIANLIDADQWTYLESLLSYCDMLVQLNLETPKFMGRALLNHDKTQSDDWLDKSEKFLMQGQQILPNDPEIYYHLGQLYHRQKRYDEAVLMLKQCLMISHTYTPAKELMASMQ